MNKITEKLIFYSVLHGNDFFVWAVSGVLETRNFEVRTRHREALIFPLPKVTATGS